jgi:hypothetical protein
MSGKITINGLTLLIAVLLLANPINCCQTYAAAPAASSGCPEHARSMPSDCAHGSVCEAAKPDVDTALVAIGYGITPPMLVEVSEDTPAQSAHTNAVEEQALKAWPRFLVVHQFRI